MGNTSSKPKAEPTQEERAKIWADKFAKPQPQPQVNPSQLIENSPQSPPYNKEEKLKEELKLIEELQNAEKQKELNKQKDLQKTVEVIKTNHSEEHSEVIETKYN